MIRACLGPSAGHIFTARRFLLTGRWIISARYLLRTQGTRHRDELFWRTHWRSSPQLARPSRWKTDEHLAAVPRVRAPGGAAKSFLIPLSLATRKFSPTPVIPGRLCA